MTIDDDALRPNANNLTLVRLALASAVIWSHSYWRMTGIGGKDATSWLLTVPLSQYAVDGFFFLSGFLVYRSLVQRGRVGAFVLARLTRLWPGLAVCMALTVAAGAALTKDAPGAYAGLALRSFAAPNLALLLPAKFSLPGVMCGTAACNVNGSLWTIPWEVRCYALLALAGLLGLSRPVLMRWLVLPATAAFALGLHVPGVAPAIAAKFGHGAIYNLDLIDRLWTMFALGIAAYLWRGRLVLSWWMAVALFAGAFIGIRVAPGLHLHAIFTGYAVLCAGFLSARRGSVSANWPDYSYGMYIYAFPVMMILAGLGAFSGYATLALATFAVTMVPASLSWHLVEKPCLERLRRHRVAARGAVA